MDTHNMVDIELFTLGTKPLPIEEYSDWFRILVSDDYERYAQMKEEVGSSDLKTALINNRFQYNDVEGSSTRPLKNAYSVPLILAASTCSNNVVKRLLDDGADVTCADLGFNVIHVLVMAAAETPDNEDKLLQTLNIIESHCEKDAFVDLLKTEDGESYFYPLELAANYGTFGFVRRIVNSDAYVMGKEVYGLNTRVKYDFSEYNCVDYRRELRSPIRLMLYVTNSQFDRMYSYDIMKMPVFQTWIQNKINENLPYMILWFIVRGLILISLLAVDPDVSARNIWPKYMPQWLQIANTSGSNSTWLNSSFCQNMAPQDNHPKTFLEVVIKSVNLFFVFIVLDVIELIVTLSNKDRRLVDGGFVWTKTNRVGEFAIKTVSYRFNQILLYFVSQLGQILILCGAVVYVTQMSAYVDEIKTCEDVFNTAVVIIRTLKAIYLPFVMFSILYLVEWLPYIGTFAIDLRCMISVMIKFIILTLFIQVIYVTYIVTVKELDAQNYMDALYRSFLIQIGAGDMGGLKPAKDVRYVHVIYYYSTAVLLVNYLVAVMTSQATRNAEEKRHIQLLRRLDAAILVEERIGRWVNKLRVRIFKKKKDNKIVVINPFEPQNVIKPITANR